MPRATYGFTVRARVKHLLEALLNFADDQPNGIECRWKDSVPPRLIVRTKLRTLEALLRNNGHDRRLTKRHIREALYRMQDFMEILEDQREHERGSEDWHFTLTLWSKDTSENLKQFELEWERKRPEKSKQQEEALRTSEVPFQSSLLLQSRDNLERERVNTPTVSSSFEHTEKLNTLDDITNQRQIVQHEVLAEAKAAVEEAMKRREFLNLSTQTFIYSSLQPHFRQEKKSHLISKRNLLLHYLDHYVLQLIGYKRLKPKAQQAIRHECHIATRFAILFADQVFVPAVSYYQSPICRQVLDCYQDIFDTGIIRVIADAYSLEEFQDNRLREYMPGSEEFKLYQKILDISELHPSIYSCVENTTLALNEEWNKLIQNTDIEAFFVAKVPGEIIPSDLMIRLTTLTDKLNNQAFIVKNIYPQLFEVNSLSLANELLKIINEIFFNWFTHKLKSGVVSDLIYLNQLSLKSHGVDIQYNALKTKLLFQYNELFKEIINCKPYELLMLKKDAVWNEVLYSIISPIN
jgi:hypothetical protein